MRLRPVCAWFLQVREQHGHLAGIFASPRAASAHSDGRGLPRCEVCRSCGRVGGRRIQDWRFCCTLSMSCSSTCCRLHCRKRGVKRGVAGRHQCRCAGCQPLSAPEWPAGREPGWPAAPALVARLTARHALHNKYMLMGAAAAAFRLLTRCTLPRLRLWHGTPPHPPTPPPPHVLCRGVG